MKLLSTLMFAAIGAAAFHAVMTLQQRRNPEDLAGAGAAPADPRDFSRPAGPAFGRSLDVDDPESAV